VLRHSHSRSSPTIFDHSIDLLRERTELINAGAAFADRKSESSSAVRRARRLKCNGAGWDGEEEGKVITEILMTAIVAICHCAYNGIHEDVGRSSDIITIYANCVERSRKKHSCASIVPFF